MVGIGGDATVERAQRDTSDPRSTSKSHEISQRQPAVVDMDAILRNNQIKRVANFWCIAEFPEQFRLQNQLDCPGKIDLLTHLQLAVVDARHVVAGNEQP